jgi:hypothetical protein
MKLYKTELNIVRMQLPGKITNFPTRCCYLFFLSIPFEKKKEKKVTFYLNTIARL